MIFIMFGMFGLIIMSLGLILIIGGKNTNVDPILKGQTYFLMTITFFFIGKVIKITKDEIVLEAGTASWVANTGRLQNFLRHGAGNKHCSVELFEGLPVIINRKSLVASCPWPHALPRRQEESD